MSSKNVSSRRQFGLGCVSYRCVTDSLAFLAQILTKRPGEGGHSLQGNPTRFLAAMISERCTRRAIQASKAGRYRHGNICSSGISLLLCESAAHCASHLTSLCIQLARNALIRVTSSLCWLLSVGNLSLFVQPFIAIPAYIAVRLCLFPTHDVFDRWCPPFRQRRCTAPVVVDKKARKIVNNESR